MPNLEEGRSAIPKLIGPHRIARELRHVRLRLSADELRDINALDTEGGGGPGFTDDMILSFGVTIPEA